MPTCPGHVDFVPRHINVWSYMPKWASYFFQAGLLHFQSLTLKIQDQSHGWGQSSMSHSGTNILLTHIPFIPSALPSNKVWPWKWKVKVMVKVQGQVGLTSYPLAHIPFIACQSTLPFLTYGYFEICDLGFRFKSICPSILEIQLFQHLTLKYKVKVKGEVKVQGQVRGPTSYRFTTLLFHVNQPSQSWGMAISKFTLENIRSKSRSRVRSKFKFTVVLASYQLASLSFHVNQASHSWDATVSKFPVPNKHHGTLSFFSNISCWYDTTINQLYTAGTPYNTTPYITGSNIARLGHGSQNSWSKLWIPIVKSAPMRVIFSREKVSPRRAFTVAPTSWTSIWEHN